MISKKWKVMLVAATAGVMTMMAANVMAQAPGGGPPGGMGRGMGMGGPMDRASMMERQGLNDPALKLSAAQKAEIEKIIDANIAKTEEINKKYPMAQGSPPSQEAMTARQALRTELTTALGKVLNDEQRKTWEAATASRRGGPGGGMGGPGRGGPGGPGGPGAGGPPGGA